MKSATSSDSSKKKKLVVGRKKYSLPKFNTSTDAKVSLRREMLKLLGTTDPKILDAYGGPGELWKLAYDETPNYVGVDKRLYLDGRTMVKGDNTRFLRAIDLESFDVFDLDAFGSPFESLAIISHRFKWKEKDRIAVFLTEGTGFNAAMNGLSRDLLTYIGVSPHKKTMFQIRERHALVRMAIAKMAEDMGGQIEHFRIFVREKLGPQDMLYIGYILTRKPETDAP